jgi:hypothetical protein
LLGNRLLRPKYLSLIACLLAYHTMVQHTPDYPSTDNPGCFLSTMYFFHTHILNCQHIRISPSSLPVIEKWERRDEWKTEKDNVSRCLTYLSMCFAIISSHFLPVPVHCSVCIGKMVAKNFYTYFSVIHTNFSLHWHQNWSVLCFI